MKTLPAPTVQSLVCTDRNGETVTALVKAVLDPASSLWVWHAVFPGTGEPPGEMLGASRSSEAVGSDVTERISRLRVTGHVVVTAAGR